MTESPQTDLPTHPTLESDDGIEPWTPTKRISDAKRPQGANAAIHGRLTGKKQFETNLRSLLKSEMRRRKTGRYVVLRHAVRIVNGLMHPRSDYLFQLVDKMHG